VRPYYGQIPLYYSPQTDRDLDFEALGDGPAVDRQLWISEMESAVAAARIADGTDVDGASYPPAPLDTEGSIRFRRRHRRNKQWLEK
jgi:hypothetical protein